MPKAIDDLGDEIVTGDVVRWCSVNQNGISSGSMPRANWEEGPFTVKRVLKDQMLRLSPAPSKNMPHETDVFEADNFVKDNFLSMASKAKRRALKEKRDKRRS